MGWTIHDTPKKQDLIRERVETREWDQKDGSHSKSVALKHCYSGGRFSGTLYIVWERTLTHPDGKVETNRFIEIDLLKYYPQGRGMGSWGYKDMDCCTGPCVSTCPPAYLDLCPPHDNESCRHFHARCREYWAKRREQGRKRRALKVGDTVVLVPGCKNKTVTIESIRPLIGRGEDGLRYRIPARVLA